MAISRAELARIQEITAEIRAGKRHPHDREERDAGKLFHDVYRRKHSTAPPVLIEKLNPIQTENRPVFPYAFQQQVKFPTGLTHLKPAPFPIPSQPPPRYDCRWEYGTLTGIASYRKRIEIRAMCDMCHAEAIVDVITSGPFLKKPYVYDPAGSLRNPIPVKMFDQIK